ncbi:MAG: GNAT family N-acetyltransferase [Vulcanimicrobiaceae bacterium]
MKRLYVVPTSQGLGIGVKLVLAAIEEARTLGYRRIRLDTHSRTMGKAIALYRRVGFVEIEPPGDAVLDPPPEIAAELIFMELALT